MADMDRMRELLSSYYGVDADELEAESTSPVNGTYNQRAARVDVDSSAFEALPFVREQLTSKSLPELAAYDEKLALDTRSLDANMQNLVYENYNKFIGATDTIREMRDSVGEIEQQMEKLQTNIDHLASSNQRTNQLIDPNLSKIDQLLGVRRLIKRLEFLFDLPIRLRRCIELAAYAQAVSSYNKATGVLERYAHVPSLKKIHQEASDIMHGLRLQLRDVLKSAGEPEKSKSRKRTKTRKVTGIIQTIRLLVQLGEPAKELKQLYLQWQATQLRDSLIDCIDNYEQREITSFNQKERDALDDPEHFDPEIHAVMVAHTSKNDPKNSRFRAPKHKFLFKDSCGFISQLNSQFLDSLIDAEVQYRDLFNEVEAPDEVQSMPQLCRDLVSDYLAVIKERLCLPPPSMDQTVTDSHETNLTKAVHSSLLEALQVLLKGVRSAASSLPVPRLADRAAEVIEHVLRQQVSIIFAHTRSTILSELLDNITQKRISEMEKQAKNDDNRGSLSWKYSMGDVIRSAAEQFSENIQKIAHDTLQTIRPLVRGGMQLQPEMAQIFISMAQGQVFQLMVWLASACEAIGDCDHPARAHCRDRLLDGMDAVTSSKHSSHGSATISIKDSTNSASYDDSVVRAMRRRVIVHFPMRSNPLVLSEHSFLFLSQVCKYMAEEGTAVTVSTLLGSLDAARVAADEDNSSVGALGTLTDMPALLQRMRVASQHLLQRYVAVISLRLSAAMRQSVIALDWSTLREPRQARLVIKLLCERVQSAREMLAGVFYCADLLDIRQSQKPSVSLHETHLHSTNVNRKSAQNSSLSHGAGGILQRGGLKEDKFNKSQNVDALERDIDRLFKQNESGSGVGSAAFSRNQFGGGIVDPSTGAPRHTNTTIGSVGAPAHQLEQAISTEFPISSATAMICFRVCTVLAEILRSQRIPLFGLQQLQIDVAVIHQMLTNYWKVDESQCAIVEQALHDTLTNAARRFVDGTVSDSILAPAIVYSVASEHIQHMKL